MLVILLFRQDENPLTPEGTQTKYLLIPLTLFLARLSYCHIRLISCFNQACLSHVTFKSSIIFLLNFLFRLFYMYISCSIRFTVSTLLLSFRIQVKGIPVTFNWYIFDFFDIFQKFYFFILYTFLSRSVNFQGNLIFFFFLNKYN